MNLKQLFKLNQDKVFGLDIGSSAVKIVQLHKDNDGYVVTAANIVNIANGTEDNNGREIDIVRTIRKCFQSAGVQGQLAVCSVCGPEVAVRYFKFPSLPPEEIGGAVMLEASQVCPFNVDDGVVDYRLMANGDDNVSGILVAATNKLIERKKRLAKDASLNSVLMDVDGLALLNCFSECEKIEAGQTAAILNVGSSFANLAIMGDNSLPFIRDIVYTDNDIVDEIAAENSISRETVNGILSGLETSSQVKLELGSWLQKVFQKLIVDVTKTLRYYAAREKSSSVEKIFVCGGFALLEGFVELLDNQLPVSTVQWNPFDKIRCAAGQDCEDILQKNGPAMAVAAGLAMRSI